MRRKEIGGKQGRKKQKEMERKKMGDRNREKVNEEGRSREVENKKEEMNRK